MPLALDVFSVDDPNAGSQNLHIDGTVKAVKRAIGGNAIWVADRGFDSPNAYETRFMLNCHFVVRRRGNRCVITLNGL